MTMTMEFDDGLVVSWHTLVMETVGAAAFNCLAVILSIVVASVVSVVTGVPA